MVYCECCGQYERSSPCGSCRDAARVADLRDEVRAITIERDEAVLALSKSLNRVIISERERDAYRMALVSCLPYVEALYSREGEARDMQALALCNARNVLETYSGAE